MEKPVFCVLWFQGFQIISLQNQDCKPISDGWSNTRFKNNYVDTTWKLNIDNYPKMTTCLKLRRYPPGNKHILPWEKETHLQKCRLGWDMLLPRSAIWGTRVAVFHSAGQLSVRASQRISPSGVGIWLTGERTIQVPIDVLPQIFLGSQPPRGRCFWKSWHQMMHSGIGWTMSFLNSLKHILSPLHTKKWALNWKGANSTIRDSLRFAKAVLPFIPYTWNWTGFFFNKRSTPTMVWPPKKHTNTQRH